MSAFICARNPLLVVEYTFSRTRQIWDDQDNLTHGIRVYQSDLLFYLPLESPRQRIETIVEDRQETADHEKQKKKKVLSKWVTSIQYNKH